MKNAEDDEVAVSGTKVVIENLSSDFQEQYREHHVEWIQELAEKYAFYLHGAIHAVLTTSMGTLHDGSNIEVWYYPW